MRCRRVARNQSGCISVTQALEAGLTKAALYRRVESGQLVRVLPTVLRDAAALPSFRANAQAALLWGGGDAAISHGTAGRLWGMDGCETSDIHLTIPSPRRAPQRWVVTHRAELQPKERVRLGRLYVTSPARTILDIAATTALNDLELVLESALRNGTLRVERIKNYLNERGMTGRRGAANLRSLLAERSGYQRATDSVLDTKVQRLLRDAGIRGFQVRPSLTLTDGSRVEPDFFFPVQRVAIEAQGYRYHSGRAAWEKDVDRRGRLEENAITVVEVTDHMVKHAPKSFLRRVERALGISTLPSLARH